MNLFSRCSHHRIQTFHPHQSIFKIWMQHKINIIYRLWYYLYLLIFLECITKRSFWFKPFQASFKDASNSLNILQEEYKSLFTLARVVSTSNNAFGTNDNATFLSLILWVNNCTFLVISVFWYTIFYFMLRPIFNILHYFHFF